MGETLYYVEERNLFFIAHISGWQRRLDCSKKDMKDKQDWPPIHSGEQSLQIILKRGD
jgi:hypothetical protein